MRFKDLYSAFLLGLTFLSTLEATYIPVYNTTDNGSLSWTGNTLGLNKASNVNQPGIQGAIGAFITTDTLQQVNTYPPGTTLNWMNNSSTAELDLPEGSTILYAELIWSGSYGFDPAVSPAVLNTQVTFTPPSGIPTLISPNPATAQSRQESSGRGFYVRSANVTPYVSTAGTYTVGGVPGTAIATENNSNCCGWTLAVAYRNPQCLTTNLNLYVACEASGAAPALVSGFRAPDTGSITSRLFVSALEGDARSTGDRLLVGATTPLSYPVDRVTGTNNPANNFFASQINTLLPLTTDILSGKLVSTGSSQLDTRGSFGFINSLASGTDVTGARQGYDITSVDLGSRISNSQQQLYVQGTTAGEAYTINALGIAIEVQAPIINSLKSTLTEIVNLGDIVEFNFAFQNVGETLASNLVFTDILPTGLNFVPGSFLLQGSPVPAADIATGVAMGDLGSGGTINVFFQAQVAAIPTSSYDNSANVNYSFVPFAGATPIPLASQTNTVTLIAPATPFPIANQDFGTTNANTVLYGESILENDIGTDLSVLSFSSSTAQGGTVTVQPTGEYIYTPPADFSGFDSFTYVIIDLLGRSANSFVTITVLPVAVNDEGTVAANTSLSPVESLLSNDLGTNLSVTTPNVISDAGGIVTINPAGFYTYTPPLNFTGIDTFNYTIEGDINEFSTATVTINVIGAAVNDEGTTPANVQLNGDTVFANDPGVGTITAYDAVSTQLGTVTMNTTTGVYIYTPPLNFSGTDTFTYTVDISGVISIATVTITVTPVAVDNNATAQQNTTLFGVSVLTNDIGSAPLAIQSYDTFSIGGGTVVMDTFLGTYTYKSSNNFTGSDTFNYTLIDPSGNTSTATVTILVLTGAGGNSGITYASQGLVGNSVISGASGQTLSILSFDVVSDEGGTVSMNADGTYLYLPPAGYSGYDSFTYTTIDGNGNTALGIVNITVLPLANPDYASTTENTPVSGNLLANDVGLSLFVLNYESLSLNGGVVSVNQLTGEYTYTPPTGFTGVDTFNYIAADENSLESNLGVVTIVVAAVAPPINFVGTLQKCPFLNRTTYKLTATWDVDPQAAFYNIYYNGQLVETFNADEILEYGKCLFSKQSATGYSISSVNANNAESARTPIRIIKI